MRMLERAGWVHVRTKGDHWHFRHPQRPDVVTLTHPRRDVTIGVVKDIERKSGLKLRS
ncbi:MAG: type II toxin-antitoxin system HicA family toxin [Sandaracinobacteroides sp.]